MMLCKDAVGPALAPAWVATAELAAPQQYLNRLPLPQGQGPFRGVLDIAKKPGRMRAEPGARPAWASAVPRV